MEPFEALVLRSQEYRETSVLLTLLTDRFGVVRALAKGARRRGAVPPAALEPPAWIAGGVSLRAPDALGTLGGLELRNAWAYLHGDPQRWAYAMLGIELLGRIAAVSPPEPSWLREGCAFLAALEHASGPGSLAVQWLVRLLHLAGLAGDPAAAVPPMLQPLFDHPAPLDPRWTLGRRDGEAALRRLLKLWEHHLGPAPASARFLEAMVWTPPQP